MQYIQAVENGADLVRCRDEDSQANCNILAGEEKATCESKIKFCTCHTIEVEQAGSTLGYIPHAFFGINKNGAYLQAPGEIQIKIDDGLWRREGNCTFNNDALGTNQRRHN